MTRLLTAATTTLGRIASGASRLLLARGVGVGLTLLAAVAGIVTYSAAAGLLPSWVDTARLFSFLLTADLVVVGLLVIVVTVRLVEAWQERRRGAAGSRLHVRLVLMFSLFAMTPTFLLAIISPYFFQVLQENILGPAKSGLRAASEIMRVGFGQQEVLLNNDLADISGALQQLSLAELTDSARLQPILQEFVDQRPVIEVTVVLRPNLLIATALPRGVEPSEATIPPQEVLQKATDIAAPVTFIRQGRRSVYSAMQIYSGEQVFLIAGHPIDPTLWLLRGPIEQTREFYEFRDANIDRLQIAVFLVYATIALLMLLSAASLGITFATRMTRPIARLMSAAEQVSHGNLGARVEEGAAVDELGELARAFNRMTDQLAAQRHDIEEAYRLLDVRRQLTEAVLEGVSSGVISLDSDWRIERANRPALALLSESEETLLGRNLHELLPEIGDGLAEVRARGDRIAQRQIELTRVSSPRTLLVRIAARMGEDGPVGYVITFDDVTDLLAAQRMAAWGDVARRIAHEIKNPLTPIQLSAERLKRRYLRQIKDDPETFTVCTDTIVRQVGDIGRMVDEFSSFARMPRPTVHDEDLKDLCHQAVFLQRTALAHIRFVTEMPDHPVTLRCDRRLVGQALTNLLKNAAEAIEGRDEVPGAELPKGEIVLSLVDRQQQVVVSVADNGKGLPVQDRARLTEPYVTTRSKGTGLGLAIVKKIMEDHAGSLELEDREGGGARVSLVFHRPTDADVPEGEPRRSAATRPN